MNENKNNEVIFVGLPNSGKSTLINTLTSSKTSIVGSKPNTTRDKISTKIAINNKEIILSDLPGFDENPDSFNKTFQHKIEKIFDDANRILFVIDVNSKNFDGLDRINNILQKQGVEKKILTVFNKCENFEKYDLDKRFFKYIYDKEVYISGYHKIGTDELLNEILKYSDIKKNNIDNNSTISLIGKPNSGKSTLFNAFLNEERSIVSKIPGTTRDSIKEEVYFDNKLFNVVDTAGVPRKKQKDQIDRYASNLSLNVLSESLISFIVVDASLGINLEDLRLINESVENFCTPILVLNKWDLLDEEHKEKINSSLKHELKKFTWLKILRISALTKKGLNKFSNTLYEINEQLNKRIDTSELNLYFRELWVANPPHPFRGRRAKLKYVTQYDTFPPSFSFHLSSRVPRNYISFLENKLRDDFLFNNVALKIKFKT